MNNENCNNLHHLDGLAGIEPAVKSPEPIGIKRLKPAFAFALPASYI